MTLSASRFSIRFLMVVVLLVAADFGIVRGLWGSPFPPGVALAVIPMANLLILAWPKSPARRFWVGFELVGWIVILTIVWLGFYGRQVLFAPMIRLEGMKIVPRESENLPLLIAEFIVIYTVPQVLLAWFGGWLSSRYKILFGRR